MSRNGCFRCVIVLALRVPAPAKQVGKSRRTVFRPGLVRGGSFLARSEDGISGHFVFAFCALIMVGRQWLARKIQSGIALFGAKHRRMTGDNQRPVFTWRLRRGDFVGNRRGDGLAYRVADRLSCWLGLRFGIEACSDNRYADLAFKFAVKSRTEYDIGIRVDLAPDRRS